MFLSANDIRTEVESGKLSIAPFTAQLLKPASYVLRVGNRWRTWKKSNGPVEVWSPNAGQDYLDSVVQSEEFIIPPSCVVLASTVERVSVPNNLVGIMSTLSHLARFGLAIHMNSFIISPGFGKREPTHLTLEISSLNPTPVKLKAGTPVCHLAFVRTSSSFQLDKPLGKSIYEGRDALCAPMLYEEFLFSTPEGEGSG